MSLVISKTKSNLVRALLTSSVLVASVSYINVAHSAATDINATGLNTTTLPQGGGNYYNFNAAAVTFNVLDGAAIGNDGGVSIDNTTPVANSTLIFDGASVVSGSIGKTNPINTINFNGAEGKTVTVATTTDANNLNFNSTGTTTFTGATNTTNANFNSGSTTNFTGGLTATGQLNFLGTAAAGDATVTGDMEGADLVFQNGGTVVLNDATTVKNSTTATGAGTATFVGAYDQKAGNAVFSDSFRANFNAAADFAGDLTLNNNAIVSLDTGTVTGNLNVNDASKIIFNDTYKIKTDLALGATGTVQVASNKTVTVTGDLTDAGAGSHFIYDLANTALAGKIVVTNNAAINNTQFVTIQNANLADFAFGSTSQNLVTAAGGVASSPTLTAPSNLFISFALDSSAATALKLVAIRSAPTGLDSNISGVAGVLAGVTSANSSGALVDLVNALGNMSDLEGQKEALESVAPLIDGAITNAVMNIQDNTFDLFSKRITELRAGLDTYHTGYAAGHRDEYGHGTWVKLFANHASQKERRDVDGYKAETWGIAAGLDMMLTNRLLLGVGLSWASVDVNHDLNSGDTDINSYQASIYGGWNISGPMFFNWMASAAYNDYDTTRHTIAGAFNQTTLADYDGWQYGARGELGYVFGEEALHITPMASLTYSHVDFDGYRERGVSTANQFVNYDNVDALWAGIGVKFSYDCQWQQSRVSPEIHANVAYDLIGDEAKASSQFVQFGSVYDTVGASSARTDYNLGMSVTTWGDSGLGMSLSYDFNWKNDYHAHSGFVRVRYEW
jgi:outer membrane autotransporter protein